MKISVTEKGKITIDGEEITIEKLTPEILEKILDKGLTDEAIFDLPADTSHPVVSLIKELKELTDKNSEFRMSIEEIIKTKIENEEKIKKAETLNDEKSNSDISKQ